MAGEASQPRRDVSGILLLDKPGGTTSNGALQRAKRLFNASKAGHTGSLDPLATGMLPICFGAATKVSGLLLGASKTYRVTAEFGAATDTGDAEGRIVERRTPEPPAPQELERALASLRGDIDQVPPMFSAVKHGGRRLYELARKGQEVRREPRRVTIHELVLESLRWPSVVLYARCSKGTYIRTLVTDLAAALGTVGHVTALRRLAVDPFDETPMAAFAELEAAAESGMAALDAYLLSPDAALTAWPSVELDAETAGRLRFGQAVPVAPGSPAGRVRVYASGDRFIGIGEVTQGGELKPKKIFG